MARRQEDSDNWGGQRKGSGRPLAGKKPRDSSIMVQMTTNQKKQIKQHAKKTGNTISDIVRELLTKSKIIKSD